MPFDEPEATQLVDTRAQPNVLTDGLPHDASDDALDRTLMVPRDPAPPVTPQSPGDPRSARIAALSERCIAGLFDVALLWIGYWGLNCGYHLITHGFWYGSVPVNSRTGGLIFHTVYLAGVFLYYFVCEGLAGATIGKWACALRVRTPTGALPSLGAIALRTLFRGVDLLPFVIPGLCGLLVMESTARHQRIGDFIANTVVVKCGGAVAPDPITWDRLAGAFSRLCAGLIDGALWVGLLCASLLLLTDERPLFSHWLLLTLPSVWLLLPAALMRWTHTTPGLWLTGHRLVQENGLPLTFAHAVIRMALVPFDLPLGLPAVFLSPRKQRLGDLVAGTLAVRAPRNVGGFVHGALLLVLLGVVGLAAWNNPRRFLTDAGTYQRNFRWHFIPSTELFPLLPQFTPAAEPFMLRNFRFAEGKPENIRQPATYVAGETAWFVFDIHGYTLDSGEVWLQEDLAIRYPDNSFGLRQENIIDYKQVLRTKGPIELKNNVRLPVGFPTGKYTVFLTIRDQHNADAAPIVHTETFYVK